MRLNLLCEDLSGSDPLTSKMNFYQQSKPYWGKKTTNYTVHPIITIEQGPNKGNEKVPYIIFVDFISSCQST